MRRGGVCGAFHESLPAVHIATGALYSARHAIHFSRMKLSLFTTLLGIVGFAFTVFADSATEMVEATFKVWDPAVTGTCFLVKRDAPDEAIYLVTAAHVFEGMKADKATLVLRERREDGTFKKREHKLEIKNAGKALWVRHPKDDVAVLRITSALPVPAPTVPMNALADEARLKAAALGVTSQLFVLTYPTSFEANEAGFPVARQGIIASHPLLPYGKKHTFLADFTAFDGDSGGPVFIPGGDGHPVVIGMVIAQFRSDEKVKSKYEERSVHYPLGLGDVLHAKYVRETLEEAAKQETPKPAPEPVPAQ